MAVTDAASIHERPGTRIGLVTTITATASNMDVQLHDEAFSFNPDANRELIERNFSRAGQVVQKPNSVKLGLVNPSASFNGPLTDLMVAIMIQSLFQDVTWATDSYNLTQSGAGAATKFIHAEQGVAGTDRVIQAVGGVVSSATIAFGAKSASDGGDARISGNIMFANSTYVDAFSGVSGMTTDSEVFRCTTDFAFTIGGSGSDYLSASLNLTNGSHKSTEIASTPGVIFRGSAQGDGGSITVQKLASGDSYADLLAAHEAGTTLALKWADGTDMSFEMDAKIGPPSTQGVDDQEAATFPFLAVSADASDPNIIVKTANLSW